MEFGSSLGVREGLAKEVAAAWLQRLAAIRVQGPTVRLTTPGAY